jgi:MOSC domain-containing protein YiiM
MRWGNWSTWSSMPSSRLKTSECANQSLEIPEEYPFVAAVSASKKHDFTKESRENVVLLSGLGVVGDAHCGARVQHLYDMARHPTRPNLRQVHLLEHELLDELQRLAFDAKAGALGENITTRNLPLLELKAGSLLQVGTDAILRVTGLRTPCVKIGRLGKGQQAAVTMRGDKFAFMKGAVMAVVIAGGKVSPGNAIRVQQPAGTAKFLQPV